MIIGFALYKWKKTKYIILMIITAGSLGHFKNISANALGTNLLNKTTNEYKFGSEYSEAIPSISGYNYIGYIHNYSKDQKSNGTVTVKFVDELDKEVVPSKTLTGTVDSDWMRRDWIALKL